MGSLSYGRGSRLWRVALEDPAYIQLIEPLFSIHQEHLCLAVPQEKVDEKVAESPEIKFSEKASQQLSRAIFALRRYGWLGFWAQLSLSLTSAVVLIFSVSFTAEVGLADRLNMRAPLKESNSASLSMLVARISNRFP